MGSLEAQFLDPLVLLFLEGKLWGNRCFSQRLCLIAFCWEHKEHVILSYPEISFALAPSAGSEWFPGKLAYWIFKSSTGSQVGFLFNSSSLFFHLLLFERSK